MTEKKPPNYRIGKRCNVCEYYEVDFDANEFTCRKHDCIISQGAICDDFLWEVDPYDT